LYIINYFIGKIENHVFWAWLERIGSAVIDLTDPKKRTSFADCFFVYSQYILRLVRSKAYLFKFVLIMFEMSNIFAPVMVDHALWTYSKAIFPGSGIFTRDDVIFIMEYLLDRPQRYSRFRDLVIVILLPRILSS